MFVFMTYLEIWKSRLKEETKGQIRVMRPGRWGQGHGLVSGGGGGEVDGQCRRTYSICDFVKTCRPTAERCDPS